MKKVAWKCGCVRGQIWESRAPLRCCVRARRAPTRPNSIRHNLRRPKLIFNYWIGACVIYAFIMVIIERRAQSDGSVATCMLYIREIESRRARALTSRARETISERVNWSRNAATGENQEINHIMQWPPSSCCCWPGCAHTPRSFSQIPILRGIRNMLAYTLY